MAESPLVAFAAASLTFGVFFGCIHVSRELSFRTIVTYLWTLAFALRVLLALL